VKVLSIRQPWAWLIVNGHKDVENRTWRTTLRGPILIHASTAKDGLEYSWASARVARISPVELPAHRDAERGGIVGVADLVDCRRRNLNAPRDEVSPWHEEGCFGFYLAHAAPLPFHPCKGRLGFFQIDTPMCADCGDTGTVKHERLTSRASVGEPCPCALGRWLKARDVGLHRDRRDPAD
jgi:hypothetical protein